MGNSKFRQEFLAIIYLECSFIETIITANDRVFTQLAIERNSIGFGRARDSPCDRSERQDPAQVL